MTVIMLKALAVAGRVRRPGELVDVSETEGRKLVESGAARERTGEPGPAETKGVPPAPPVPTRGNPDDPGDPDDPGNPDDPDDGEEPDGGREPENRD